MILVLVLILIAVLYSTERGRDFLYTVYLIIQLPFLFLFRIFLKKSKKQEKEEETKKAINKIFEDFFH